MCTAERNGKCNEKIRQSGEGHAICQLQQVFGGRDQSSEIKKQCGADDCLLSAGGADADELQYGMADRYEISENQKVYTFYLRDDACYSDGMPVTAGDFLRAFQRLMEPENFNSYAAIIKNAEDIYQGKKKIEELGVTVLDEKTLQIELEHPQVQFLQLLALRSFAPIREDAAEILRP